MIWLWKIRICIFWMAVRDEITNLGTLHFPSFSLCFWNFRFWYVSSETYQICWKLTETDSNPLWNPSYPIFPPASSLIQALLIYHVIFHSFFLLTPFFTSHLDPFLPFSLSISCWKMLNMAQVLHYVNKASTLNGVDWPVKLGFFCVRMGKWKRD